MSIYHLGNKINKMFMNGNEIAKAFNGGALVFPGDGVDAHYFKLTFHASDTDNTIVSGGSVTPRFKTVAGATFRYSVDHGTTWVDTASGVTVSNISGSILFRGTGRAGLCLSDDSCYWTISTAATANRVSISGDISTLLDYVTPVTVLDDYAFRNMFANAARINDASSLIIPFETMSPEAFYNFFLTQLSHIKTGSRTLKNQ